MKRNVIEQTGYRKEVLQLAALGVPAEEIADKLNNWDMGQAGITFTGAQVLGFLDRALEGGKSKALELQRAKDVTDLTATAKGQLDWFKSEARMASQTNDLRKYKVLSELMLAWFDRNTKLEGLDKPGDMHIQINQISVDIEKDALFAAVKDYLKDNPVAWEAILNKAKGIRESNTQVVDASWFDKGTDASN